MRLRLPWGGQEGVGGFEGKGNAFLSLMFSFVLISR